MFINILMEKKNICPSACILYTESIYHNNFIIIFFLNKTQYQIHVTTDLNLTFHLWLMTSKDAQHMYTFTYTCCISPINSENDQFSWLISVSRNRVAASLSLSNRPRNTSWSSSEGQGSTIHRPSSFLPVTTLFGMLVKRIWSLYLKTWIYSLWRLAAPNSVGWTLDGTRWERCVYRNPNPQPCYKYHTKYLNSIHCSLMSFIQTNTV